MQCSHIFFSMRWMIPCSAGATLVFDWRGIPRSCWHHSSLWQDGGHPVPPRPLAGRAVKMQSVDWFLNSSEMFRGKQQLSLCTRPIESYNASRVCTLQFAAPIGVVGRA